MLQVPSKESFRTQSFDSDQKFGKVARALWPKKTADQLAYRCGVSKRTAEHWIYGDREPSAIAVLAVNSEMLNRD